MGTLGKLCILFALTAGAASAQTWVLVAMEGSTLTSMPVGTTWRFGSLGGSPTSDPGGFSASFVSTATNPKLPIYIYYTSFTFPDPDSGYPKGFYVAEGATAYTVGWTDTTGKAQTKTIPALVVVVPPPVTKTCTNGTATTYTLTSSVTFNAAGFIIAGTPGMTCQ